MMDIQWYPGHMAKTIRLLKESVKLVDAVIEIVDARIPKSSRNPVIDELAAGKGRVIVFNKWDLCDKTASERWARYYEKRGAVVVKANCLTGEGVPAIEKAIRRLCAGKVAAFKAKGALTVTVRAMCVGVPNVGKSTLINRYAGKKAAKTEDRPGVTRNKQWIRVRSDFELLDTPGILWNKFDDDTQGLYIALTGGVSDKITDIVTLSTELIRVLQEKYTECLVKRYGGLITLNALPADILSVIGTGRGYLLKGGETDLARTAAMIIDEFRAGKLGGITLDSPPEL